MEIDALPLLWLFLFSFVLYFLHTVIYHQLYLYVWVGVELRTSTRAVSVLNCSPAQCVIKNKGKKHACGRADWFFNHLGWTWVARLGGKCLYLPSYIADPFNLLSFFFVICRCNLCGMGRRATVNMWRSEQLCGISSLLLLGGFRDWNWALNHLTCPILFFGILEKSPGPVWLTSLLFCCVSCSVHSI